MSAVVLDAHEKVACLGPAVQHGSAGAPAVQQPGPGSAMAVIAAISVTVTLLLAPGLRSGARTTPVPSTAPGI
jgi:hypothetical protein